MNADGLYTIANSARSERLLLKMLADVRPAEEVDAANRSDRETSRSIKEKLLSIRMQAHANSSPVERDLWRALHQHELNKTESNGRKFEDSNFRRRVEALGILNAAVECVLYLRTRASSKLTGVPLEDAILRHPLVFGTHLCDVARKNLELRFLVTPLHEDWDDE